MLFVVLFLSLLLMPQVGVAETYYIHPSGDTGRSCNTASASEGCSGASTCARQTIAVGRPVWSGAAIR